MEELVPLSQGLFPAALAQAFGLPSIDGTPAPASERLQLPGAKPRKAAESGAPNAYQQQQQAPWQSLQPKQPSPQGFTNPQAPPQQQQQQQQQKQKQQVQPTTSGSSVGLPNYHNGSMYMSYPPPYSSALPSVFGNQLPMYGQLGGLGQGGPIAEFSGMSFSGGAPPGCRPPQYGVRMGTLGAAHSSKTETTDEDNGDGARAIKRARLVWTLQLHKRFEEALLKLGPERSIPKNIMQEMNVEGLTRENVASHLQKFRLLKKGGDDCTSQERNELSANGLPPLPEDAGQQAAGPSEDPAPAASGAAPAASQA